jgi:hypothetical protein
MKTTPGHTPQEFLASLRTLRMLVREVGSNYVAALQSDVARVEQAVREANTDERLNRKQRSQLRTMLKTIHDTHVKPEKGRRRDLKELDKLIAKLSDTVDGW